MQPKHQDYRYFEGISGVHSLWAELTDDLKTIPQSEAICCYAGARKAYENILGIFEAFHRIRVLKGIRYRIIYPLGETELAKRREKQLAEARFMDLHNEVAWVIVGGKLVIQNITQKVPKAFVIEDKLFILTFKQMFNQLWNVAKK